MSKLFLQAASLMGLVMFATASAWAEAQPVKDVGRTPECAKAIEDSHMEGAIQEVQEKVDACLGKEMAEVMAKIADQVIQIKKEEECAPERLETLLESSKPEDQTMVRWCLADVLQEVRDSQVDVNQDQHDSPVKGASAMLVTLVFPDMSRTSYTIPNYSTLKECKDAQQRVSHQVMSEPFVDVGSEIPESPMWRPQHVKSLCVGV